MPAEYTDWDTRLASDALFEFKVGASRVPLALQYPPVVLSDVRKAEWNAGADKPLPGNEPIAIFASTGARELAIRITYIVDGGLWTTRKVAEQVRLVRGYYSRAGAQLQKREELVVNFKLWAVGGSELISARLKSVDIKHSETIVAPNDGLGSAVPDTDEAYFLKTDITLDLAIWTKGTKDAPTAQDIPELSFLTPDWF